MSVNAERNCTVYISQGREVWLSHQPHELKVVGPNPTPASEASIGEVVRKRFNKLGHITGKEK